MFVEINDKIYNMDKVAKIEYDYTQKKLYFRLQGEYIIVTEKITDRDYIEFRSILNVKQI